MLRHNSPLLKETGGVVKKLISVILLCCATWSHLALAETAIKTELSDWEKLGIGKICIVDDQAFTLNVPTLDKSKGLIFLSDKALPTDYRVSFDFQTSNPEGVMVMLLAFTDIDGGPVVVPDDYDGNWGYFRDGDDHSAYAIALHTHAHQPNTFIRKIPGFDLLVQTRDPFEHTGSTEWNHLTIEKKGDNIKLMLAEQQLLLEVNDFKDKPLGKGYLGFRLSPAEDKPFTVEYKNLVIETLK